MYESHFGLSGPPFQLNPDPAFYYDSKGHSHALAYLKYGAHQGEGFIVVTGEIGAGKTTVVRTLLEGLDTSKVVAAQIVSTQLESGELLRAILTAYGVPVSGDSKAHLISTLEAFLTALAARGKRALLIIDEAQNLQREAVEELRMLSNFQLGNHALLQSFLVGQPELRALLKSKQMEQLRQRVIASCHLEPLDLPETRSYIEHRLRRVNWNGSPQFAPAAYDRIHQWTGGVPRRINRLCNRLLLAAYLANTTEISEAMVVETATELRSEIGEASDIPTLSVASSVIELPVATKSVDLVANPAGARQGNGGSRARQAHSGPRGTLLCLCETRTDYWKLAALAQVLGERPDIPSLTIVYPGSEKELAAGAVGDRVLPVPYATVHLGLEGGDYAQLAAAASLRFDALLTELSPSALLSFGTSDAVLMCTLLAKKRGLGIFRFDAGQRDGDAESSNAINAMLLDRLADELYTEKVVHYHTLYREGIGSDRVQCIGSLVSNFVYLATPHLPEEKEALAAFELTPNAVQGGYALLCYRLPSSTGVIKAVGQLLPVLRALSHELHIVWPLRENEAAMLESAGIEAQLTQAGVLVVRDKGYIESLNLMRHARCLINGVEREFLEEAVALGKPSITTGAAATMPVASGERSNLTVGLNVDQAVRAVRAVLSSDGMEFEAPEFWDGGAGARVAKHLRHWLRRQPQKAIRGLEQLG